MIKRTTTTTYEYDNEGKIIKKTIVEEVIEEQLQQYPLTNPCKQHEFWWQQPYCDNNSTSGANPNLTTTTTTINWHQGSDRKISVAALCLLSGGEVLWKVLRLNIYQTAQHKKK